MADRVGIEGIAERLKFEDSQGREVIGRIEANLECPKCKTPSLYRHTATGGSGEDIVNYNGACCSGCDYHERLDTYPNAGSHNQNSTTQISH